MPCTAPGQSGDPLSPHFADQLALYANWNYKVMAISSSHRSPIESVLRLVVP